MSTDSPPSWRDTDSVATVVDVLETGALFFYGALVESAPPLETIGFVLLWVFVPVTLARELARRWL